MDKMWGQCGRRKFKKDKKEKKKNGWKESARGWQTPKKRGGGSPLKKTVPEKNTP